MAGLARQDWLPWATRVAGLAALVFLLAGCGGGGASAPVSSPGASGPGLSGATVQFTVGVDSSRSRDVDAVVTEFAVSVLDEDQEDDLIEAQVFPRTSGARASQKLTVQGVPVTGKPQTVVVEARDRNHDTVAMAMVTRTLAAGPNEMVGDAEACISGKLTFDRVGETLKKGLDYGSITKLPIAGAAVELIDATSEDVLSTGVTESDGTYRLPLRGSATHVKVRAWARSASPGLLIVDNTTAGRPVYSMVSGAVAAEPAVMDLHADCGWDKAQKKYARPRTAGPFAILYVLHAASKRVLGVRPDVSFPTLSVCWSVNNSTTEGKVERGEIGTSKYSGSEKCMFILGKEDDDTDEYDWHVMCHEWGHYFQDKNSRDDSVAGDHGDGDILDPRVAFSEGFGNAWAGVMLYPDRVYKDSSGLQQATAGNCFDLQSNDVKNPGWFSEASVQAVMYNTFDPASDLPETKVDLGSFIDALTSPVKTTRAFTTVFPFVRALQTSNEDKPLSFDTLLDKHGISPITDDYGTGQTDSGGVEGLLPLYRPITVDGKAASFTLDAPTDKATNKLAAHRYLRVKIPARATTVLRTDCPANLEIVVRDGGRPLESFTTSPGENATNLRAVSNGLVVIDIGLENKTTRPVTCTAEITTQ